MTKKLTIKEAITDLGMSEKTIRRRIQSGQLLAEKRGNQWLVLVNDDQNNGHDDQKPGQTDHPHRPSDHANEKPDPSAFISQLQSENQYLREQVDHLTQIVAMSQKNVAMLTEQLDSSRQMISDMRQRSWWKRAFRWR